MMKNRAIAILIAGVVLSASAHAEFGILFQTGFEQPDYTAGEDLNGQDGWYASEGSATDAFQPIGATSYEGDQSLRMDIFKAGNTTARTFDEVASDILRVTFAIGENPYRTDNNDMRFQLWLSETSAFSLSGAGVFVTTDGSVNTQIRTYDAAGNSFDTGYDVSVDGSWNTFRMDVYVEEQQFDLFFSQTGEAFPTQKIATGYFRDDINSLSALHIKNWQNGATLMFDNLTIEHIPEPGTLSMLALAGGALMVLRKRRKTSATQS